MIPPPAWHDQAACRDTPTGVFYPVYDGDGSAYRAAETAAKNICEHCPAAAECLAWALTNETHGIWGGTSEKDRRRMRRQLAAAGTPIHRATPIQHGTVGGYRRCHTRPGGACHACRQANARAKQARAS